MLEPGELDEIEKRAAEATEGPWEVDGMDSGHSRFEMDLWITAGDAGDTVCSMDGLTRAGNEKVAKGSGGADAWFIAHARTDVVRLVEEVRRLRRLEDRLKRRIEDKKNRLNEAASAYSHAYNNDLDARASEAMHQVMTLQPELDALEDLIRDALRRCGRDWTPREH